MERAYAKQRAPVSEESEPCTQESTIYRERALCLESTRCVERAPALREHLAAR